LSSKGSKFLGLFIESDSFGQKNVVLFRTWIFICDMDTVPLDKQEKETLLQWLRGHVVRNAQGNPINHRIWFKNIFNPFLRSMGWVIITKCDENGTVIGYQVRKYKRE
jgi:hypothetical protein